MSYILDALRKSERERQAGQTPGLPNLMTETRSRSPQRLIWIIAALGVINLVGVGYWVWVTWIRAPKSPATVVTSTAPLPDSTAAGHASALDQTPTPPPVITDPPGVFSPHPPQAPLQPLAQLPHESFSATQNHALTMVPSSIYPDPPVSRVPDDFDEVDREMEEEGDTRQASSEERVRPHPGVRAGAPALRDLPPDFQSRIPPFRITMFAYTENPEERFVIVNMKKIHAGEMLPGGVLLLEIQAENLLVEFDGQKFLIPRF